MNLTRGAREVVSLRLQRDASSPFWHRTTRFFLELGGAPALGLSLGGEISRGCTNPPNGGGQGGTGMPPPSNNPCQQGRVLGGYGVLRGGFQLASGLNFGVAAGYFAAEQTMLGRIASMQISGMTPRNNQGSLDDTVALNSLLTGAFVGFSVGKKLASVTSADQTRKNCWPKARGLRGMSRLSPRATTGYIEPLMTLRTISAWDEETEVLVIGGGPGGSATAAHLAQRGRKALILEQARFPRFHIGESLLPASAAVLKLFGLEEEMDRRFVRKYSARFFDDDAPEGSPAGTARYQFSDAFAPSTPYSWQVTRAEFDELLLRRATELGAEVREGFRVQRAIFEGDTVIGVEATSPAGEARRIGARVVVDATGRDALLARGAGQSGASPARRRLPGLDKTALFTHIQGGHRNTGIDEGQIELIILAGQNPDGSTPGWAWFIPFRDGRTSIGFVLSSDVVGARIHDARALLGDGLGPAPREYEGRPAEAERRLAAVFDAEVERSPAMRRLIGDAPRIAPVRAAADYSFRVEKLAGNGWLSVGDATGFIDPLFSTGAHMAMGGGVLAAAAIDAALAAGDVSEARFQPYAKMLRGAADLFLGAVQSFYRGELRGLLFAQEQRAVIRRAITSMLAGDVFHDGSPPAWVGFFRERFPTQL